MLLLLNYARRMVAFAAIVLLLVSYADPISNISEQLDVDVSAGTVVSEWDTHGGFHGDGTTFMEIRFSDGGCLNEIALSPAWAPLPLTPNLRELVSRLRDPEDAPLLPHVSNGYYCFIDRFYTATDPKDDTNVLRRGSFNFTLAVYDADTNILYYIEEDT